MKTAPPGLALLDPMELLVGCRTESDRSIAGTLVANHTSNFSAWSEPVSLGPAINTPGFNDQQAVLSKDGLSLYFASDRPWVPRAPGRFEATYRLSPSLERTACWSLKPGVFMAGPSLTGADQAETFAVRCADDV